MKILYQFFIFYTFFISSAIEAKMFIINLGRGVTASGIIKANKEREVPTIYINMLLPKLDLKPLQDVKETDQIVLIGHCGSGKIASNIDPRTGVRKIFSSSDLAMSLRRSAPDLIKNKQALLVSLISCYSAGIKEKDYSRSLALDFLFKLKQSKIKAHVIGRTDIITSQEGPGVVTIDPHRIRTRILPNVFRLTIGGKKPKKGDSVLFMYGEKGNLITKSLTIEPSLDFSLRKYALESAIKEFEELRKL